MTKTIHCHVRGVVQGVWFRGWTRDQAQSLSLAGWVRNLPDGRVEAVFSGDEAAVSAMRERLGEGPPAARVDAVDCRDTETPPSSQGFEIRR